MNLSSNFKANRCSQKCVVEWLMQDVMESRKVSWFKLTDKCMGKKTIKNHKDSGKNTDNCQVAGSWCSKGAASVAWPHDTLLLRTQMGLWTLYTPYFRLSITPHKSWVVVVFRIYASEYMEKHPQNPWRVKRPQIREFWAYFKRGT